MEGVRKNNFKIKEIFCGRPFVLMWNWAFHCLLILEIGNSITYPTTLSISNLRFGNLTGIWVNPTIPMININKI